MYSTNTVKTHNRMTERTDFDTQIGNHRRIHTALIEQVPTFGRNYIQTSQSPSYSEQKIVFDQYALLKRWRQEYEIIKHTTVDDVRTIRSDIDSSKDSIATSKMSRNNPHKGVKLQSQKEMSHFVDSLLMENRKITVSFNTNIIKLEEALRRERDYKRYIQELKAALSARTKPAAKEDPRINELLRGKAESLKEIEELKAEKTKYMESFESLRVQIGNLETKILQKNYEISRLQTEKKGLHEREMQHLTKMRESDLDARRVELEAKLDKKNFDAEVSRLNELLRVKESRHREDLESQKYRLNEDFQARTRINTHIQQAPQLENSPRNEKNLMFEILQTLKNRPTTQSTDQITELVKTALQSVVPSVIPVENGLKEELSMIKAQLHEIKEGPTKSKLLESVRLEGARNKMLEKEVESKQYILRDYQNQISLIQQANQKLIKQNEEWKHEVQEHLRQKLELENTIRKMRFEVVSAQTMSSNNIVSQRSIESERNASQEVKGEIELIRRALGEAQSNYKEQIKVLNKRVFELETANSEMQKKYELEWTKHEEDLLQQIRKLEKELIQLRQKPTKLSEFAPQQPQSERLPSLDQDRLKIEMDKLRHFYEDRIAQQEQAHSKKVQQYLNKIQSLTETQTEYLRKTEHYVQMEQELTELKHLVTINTRALSEIDHLWQVKELELSKLSSTLHQFQSGSSKISNFIDVSNCQCYMQARQADGSSFGQKLLIN